MSAIYRITPRAAEDLKGIGAIPQKRTREVVMGKVKQIAKATNLADLILWENHHIDENKVRALEIEFLVDTGAALICLPPRLIHALGLRKTKSKQALTADGPKERGIYSSIKLELFDRDAILEVMEVPENVPPLLGYIALESLDLVVNPTGEALTGNPDHGGKFMVDLL